MSNAVWINGLRFHGMMGLASVVAKEAFSLIDGLDASVAVSSAIPGD